MIVNRGEVAGIEYLEDRPEAILFVLESGAYFYVGQGIVENELRVMGNWKVSAAPLAGRQWAIVYSQGDEIPQELGDYLIAHQDLEAKVMTIRRCDVPTASIAMPELGPIDPKKLTPESAYMCGFESGVVKCCRILGGVLPVYQDDNETTDKAEKTDDKSNN